MSTPSKTAAKLLAEHRKAAEECCEREREEKEREDAKLAALQAQADHEREADKKAERKRLAREKAREEKEAEARREKAARSAQHQLDVAQARRRTMKAGGSQGNAGKERKMGCKQRGTELAELEMKCERCKKSGEKCMMPTKCKAAKAVDSDNEAGPSKRSNTMTGSSGRDDQVVELLKQLIQETRKTRRELPALIGDAVFRRMVGLSEATRWQELPLARLRNGQMEFVSCENSAEEGLGDDLDEKTKTMEEELERVNRRLRKRAEKLRKQVGRRRISRSIIDDEEDDEDQGPVAGGSGTRHSDDEGDKGKEKEKENEDGMEDIEESQTQRE
ncbi:hypothetical protein BDQ12DRAFT_664178 [Crucibulum laeve]|uniref:Uncharacterized protein n=1 Tax=Crucibulum laeve TaxID=68775 RepID=A0A5C3MA85_9AGAR|nr:hypothetical protein BDQ12DRAFT_664178 [Crucibulum laeve]